MPDSTMHSPMPIDLPAPQLIEIAGPDAIAFAQAQFSSDVLELAEGEWQWSAWLSAQGRVRAFFHLLRLDTDRLLLILRGGSAVQLRDALNRYVFRAKLALRVIDDFRAHAIEFTSPSDPELALPSGKQIAMTPQRISIALPGHSPRWLVLDAGDTKPDDDRSGATLDRNALADINAGLVTLDAALDDQLLPDWIGLGDLHATSVGKGCYPGQEIVARLHFKGGNKRWLHRLEFDCDALPAPGNSFANGDATTGGLIISSAWLRVGCAAALAVMRDNRAAEAGNVVAVFRNIRNVERVRPSA